MTDLEEALVEGRREMEMKGLPAVPELVHIVAGRDARPDLLQRVAWTADQAALTPYRVYKDGNVLKAVVFKPWEGATASLGMFSNKKKRSPGEPVILGSLDKQVIRRVVTDKKSAYRQCYDASAGKTGKAGKLVLKFIVNGQGKVTSAKVAEDGLHDAKTTNCLLSETKTLRFPKPKGGGIVIVNYPFVFKDRADEDK